jgi:hypothetical protein
MIADESHSSADSFPCKQLTLADLQMKASAVIQQSMFGAFLVLSERETVPGSCPSFG